MSTDKATERHETAPLLGLGSSEVLGAGSEARNATVLGLNDVDKQKLEEARQLAMSMTSHPVAFGTIEHTEKAGELLGLLWQEVLRLQCDLKDAREAVEKQTLEDATQRQALAREAHTWSKAAEAYAADAERFRWLAEHTVATGLARWVHPFQFLAEAVDWRRKLNRPPTPVGWSDTDWLAHLEQLQQNEAAYAKGPLPERGWD